MEKKNMDVMTMNKFDGLSIDKLSEIVGGNVPYDIGYGVEPVSYIAVEILKLRKNKIAYWKNIYVYEN